MMVSPRGWFAINSGPWEIGIDTQETRTIKRITWIGLAINVVLSGFKIAAGTLGGSQAVAADGVHSLSDLVTDLAVLIGVRYWSAPPDESHPYGHRRIETVVTFFIGLALAAAALGIGYNAVATIPESHSRPPGLIAVAAAVASIIIKEGLYHATRIAGKRARSSALMANAWHHRSDGLSSIPAALAAGLTRLFPDWYFLDHVGAVIVTVFILQAAWRIAWPALKELSDAGAGRETCERIREICLATDGVLEVHKIRTRRQGLGVQVDLHVQVQDDLTVREGHEIASSVKHALLDKGPDVIDVVTHVEPAGEVKEGDLCE